MVTALPTAYTRSEFLGRTADTTLAMGAGKCCCNPFLIPAG